MQVGEGQTVQAPGARVGGSVTVVSPAIAQGLGAARGRGGAVLGVLLLRRLVLFLLIEVLA